MSDSNAEKITARLAELLTNGKDISPKELSVLKLAIAWEAVLAKKGKKWGSWFTDPTGSSETPPEDEPLDVEQFLDQPETDDAES